MPEKLNNAFVGRIGDGQGSPAGSDPAAAGTIDGLSRFDGPLEQFLADMLAVQCDLSGASGGAILRPGQDENAQILAIHPPLEHPGGPGDKPAAPQWLIQAAASVGEALKSSAVTVKALHGANDMYGQPARQHVVLVPLPQAPRGIGGAAVYLVKAGNSRTLTVTRDRLTVTAGLLNLYEMRQSLRRHESDTGRLRQAMEVLAAINEQDRFAGAAMALCNEVAARWQCDRVGLGFLKGRYVQLKALSHTEKFSRKMKLVQDIESAMEECLDQDVEVLYPTDPQSGCVSRAGRELSNRHGPTAVLSLPLRKADECVAVLTVERPLDKTFALSEVESLRLTCDLSTARIEKLYRDDRWFGARAAGSVRKALAVLLGVKHTWIKLAAAAVFAAILFLVFAKGEYRADGTFIFQASRKQVVAAPFNSIIMDVMVEPSDKVVSGQSVLARLKTDKLKLQLAEAQAKRLGLLKRADAAMRDGKLAERQVAEAQAQEVAANIRLIKYSIAQAILVSPVTGHVLKGDLKKQIGAPVKTGDVLFEVAPLDALVAEISLPQEQIGDVLEAQALAKKEGRPLRGNLATVGDPGKRIGFVVERIDPVAQVVDKNNVFRIRVRLDRITDSMRPGIKGVAKINLGRKRYIWLWSRRMVNWVRMKLWI